MNTNQDSRLLLKDDLNFKNPKLEWERIVL